MSSPQDSDILNLHPSEEEEQFVDLLLTNDGPEPRQTTNATITMTTQQIRIRHDTTRPTPMDTTYTPTSQAPQPPQPPLRRPFQITRDPIPSTTMTIPTPNQPSLFRPYQTNPRPSPPPLLTPSPPFSPIPGTSQIVPQTVRPYSPPAERKYLNIQINIITSNKFTYFKNFNIPYNPRKFQHQQTFL